MEVRKNVAGVVGRLKPSARAQWSAFFAVLLLMLNISQYQSDAELLGAMVGAFVLFYFPVAWAYRAISKRIS